MLRRWPIAIRRAFAVSCAATRPSTAARPNAARTRAFSLWPWSRNRTPTVHSIPVYFSKGGLALRPGSRKRLAGRVLFAILAYSVCWHIYVTVVLKPLFDWVDQEWDALSDEEKDELDQSGGKDDPILFLPFPLMTKLVEQPIYRGSDPEWETFVSISKDTQLQKEIRQGLAKLILTAAAKNPQYAKVLGGPTLEVKKYWLDILYPQTPPPKHYMSGLIFYDDGIYWGSRSVDSATAMKLKVVLYPKAVAAATWAFFDTLLTRTAHDVVSGLGLSSAPTPAEAAKTQQVTLYKWMDRVIGAPDRPTTSSVSSTGDEEMRNVPEGESPGSTRVDVALGAARLALVKNWQSVPPLAYRGCVQIDGLVEIKGGEAILCVYVQASYDPKLKKYLALHTSVKRLVPLRQPPAEE